MLKKIGFFVAVLALVGYRIMPHPYNLTPLLSAALFSGLLIQNKRLQYLLPFSSMLITDALLGFYPGMIFSYVAVGGIIVLGRGLCKQKSLTTVLSGSLLASFMFYLLSNLGVWTMGHMYPLTVEGLATCYLMAVPFFQSTLESTLFFSFAFYVVYFLVKNIKVTSQYLPDAYIRGRLKGEVTF